MSRTERHICFGRLTKLCTESTGCLRLCAWEQPSHRFVSCSEHPFLIHALTETVTVAMSALWQRTPSSLTSDMSVLQPLQLRQISNPLQFVTNLQLSSYDDHTSDFTNSLFDNLQTNWLYSAAIQLTLNGSHPAWSSGGWSFVPLDISSLGEQKIPDESLSTPATNATCRTSAIRGRLECSAVDLDHTHWLTLHDLTDDDLWSTNTTSGYDVGYELGCNVNVTWLEA